MNTATGHITVTHPERLCVAEGLFVDALNIHAANANNRHRDNAQDIDDMKFHQLQFRRQQVAEHNNFMKTAFSSAMRLSDWQYLYAEKRKLSDKERKQIQKEQVKYIS